MDARDIAESSLLDPKLRSEPWPFYARLHEECPVYRMPETGAYVISRYADVRAALRDPQTFSSDVRVAGLRPHAELHQSILRDGGGYEHVQTLQRTDPPQHGRYRKLLDRVFTMKRVRELTPHIEEVANELIDGFIEGGACEFNDDFAMPMPGIIIAEQLGLERRDVGTFKRWADAMLGVAKGPVASEDEVRANAEIELEAQLFLAEVFEARRAEPRDDLMSALVHAHGDDEPPLSMAELQNLMHQLVTGGFETTQTALNHGMWTLIRFPELQERLRRDESAMKPFVEEVLRWESPVQFLARRATRDVEIGGTVIPQGSMVLVGYGPANRDAAKFACPHAFDIDRGNAGAHLGFGSGPHFCVGALLARQEMVSAFRILLERLANIELARPLPDPVHKFSLFFLPMHEFHIEFEKR